ncbi:MAG: UDP-2,3-diacylglucosamine diphosphatase LpxG [Parachlamydia sp.]|nr:UDP-2,3-diacylglucosamine diphosphatase LpxG [Parachlamydia sp.]
MSQPTSPAHSFISKIWDLACCLSIIGIWPRFIEPNMLITRHLRIEIPKLPKEIEGFTLLQFSDLHLHSQVSNRFIDKIIGKIQELRPDMILFTGDFLCFGELADKQRMQRFLTSLTAPFGCYAILGNHDYAQAVSFNDAGDYDTLSQKPSALLKGLKRLFVSLTPTGRITERARSVPLHQELVALLKSTPFELLHNQTKTVSVKGSALNVCGLGEYMLGRCDPATAFEGYNSAYPGVILAHNPDSVPRLMTYPGDLILSGHTHGGQINLPGIWKKYTIMENLAYAKGGLYPLGEKWLYVCRGVGSVLPFRLRSVPELVHITLEAKR